MTRPSKGERVTLTLRLPIDLVERLDAYRERVRLSRADAAVERIERALDLAEKRLAAPVEAAPASASKVERLDVGRAAIAAAVEAPSEPDTFNRPAPGSRLKPMKGPVAQAYQRVRGFHALTGKPLTD